MWDFDERLMTWECSGKPLVVVTLATEVPLELEGSFELGLGLRSRLMVIIYHNG